jgi:hypothetical protein
MRDKKTISESIGDELITEMETYGLYDKVKMDIYDEYKETKKHLKDINTKDIPVGRKEIAYQYYGPAFISAIIDLYIDLKPKVEYIRAKDGTLMFKDLYELDDYYFERKNVKDITFLQAKTYFDLMSLMLEKLGIKKFEIEKVKPSERINRDAFDSD